MQMKFFSGLILLQMISGIITYTLTDENSFNAKQTRENFYSAHYYQHDCAGVICVWFCA